VSKPEADGQSGQSGQSADRAALHRLEGAVGEALTQLADARERARTAEDQCAELEEVVRRFTKEDGAANLVLTRLRTLEEENTDLRARMDKGRDGVERLLARVRFLEGQR
jgi:predicted nuclease with TOPRIM domain